MDDMFENYEELGVLMIGVEDGSWMKLFDFGQQIYDLWECSWYMMGMVVNEFIILDIFQLIIIGEWVVIVVVKLVDGKGVFGVNVSFNYLKENVDQIYIGEKGKLYMLDNGGKFLFYYNIELGVQLD